MLDFGSSSKHSKWLRERHKRAHASRPLAFRVEIKGCEECLVEIIWWRYEEIIKAVTKEHRINHPNLLTHDYWTRTRPHYDGSVTAGGFKACSRCIDLIFIGWKLYTKDC